MGLWRPANLADFHGSIDPVFLPKRPKGLAGAGRLAHYCGGWEQPMIKFMSFYSAIANLKFPDKMILRGVGLNHLYKFYDAYPTQHEGERLFILLPRGMDPKTAVKLTEAAAAKQVLILQHR